MQPFYKTYLPTLTILIFIFISCTKNAPAKEDKTADFSLITQFDWINVPKADTQSQAYTQNNQYRLDSIIINDTIFLSFYEDSGYTVKRTSTEHVHLGNTFYDLPPGIPPPGNYLPHGESGYAGKFSFNPNDSTFTTTYLIAGNSFKGDDLKLIELTEDSLTLHNLSYPFQSDTAHAITHYFARRR